MLSLASRNLLKADKWPAAPVFHSDYAASVDLAAEFGLPQDLDLDTPPEVAFPAPDTGGPQLPDVGNCGETLTDNWQPTTDDSSEARVVWAADAAGLRDLVPNLVTPEYVELEEIRQIQGSEAASARSTQMMRNEQRRDFRSERKRYAEIAMNINLRRAAERLAERKLAQQQAQANPASEKPETGWVSLDWDAEFAAADAELSPGCPTPASVAGVGVSSRAAKKPAASVPPEAAETTAGKEATTA